VSHFIGLFNDSKRWEPVAIQTLQVFLPLLLHKPSLKSKNGEHIKYLNKRMEWWKHGKLAELIKSVKLFRKDSKNHSKSRTIRPESLL